MGGAVAAHKHYLQVEAPEGFDGLYAVKMTRRQGAANDHPVQLAVVGYTENNPE